MRTSYVLFLCWTIVTPFCIRHDSSLLLIGCILVKNIVLTGFGKITLLDLDTIDISNLNRQFLFKKKDVKKSKATVCEPLGFVVPFRLTEGSSGSSRDSSSVQPQCQNYVDPWKYQGTSVRHPMVPSVRHRFERTRQSRSATHPRLTPASTDHFFYLQTRVDTLTRCAWRPTCLW